MSISFSMPDARIAIDKLSDEALGNLEFGVIKMTRDAVVTGYNRAESEAAGIRPERVLGENFFTKVAPCTNNYLVASRFEDEDFLDTELDYVFTLRMRRAPVRLRLLKSPDHEHMYVFVLRQPIGR